MRRTRGAFTMCGLLITLTALLVAPGKTSPGADAGLAVAGPTAAGRVSAGQIITQRAGGGRATADPPGPPGPPGPPRPVADEDIARSPALGPGMKVAPALVDVVSDLAAGEVAAGTGIVLTAEGVVLTNAHVVEGARRVQARTVGGGTVHDATVIGRDPTHDIALLQLAAVGGLTPAALRSSSSVRPGDAVVAVGNAGGDNDRPVASAGIVTALDEAVTATDEDGSNPETLDGLLGTNARIAAGDSGGALVNTRGEVVGVNVAGKTTNRRHSPDATVGYVIPLDQAMAVAGRLAADHNSGRSQR